MKDITVNNENPLVPPKLYCQFCNNSSIELFGLDLTYKIDDNDPQMKKLNEPNFIPLINTDQNQQKNKQAEFHTIGLE